MFFFNQNWCLFRFHLQTEHLSPKPMFANMYAKRQKMKSMCDRISNLPDALLLHTHSFLRCQGILIRHIVHSLFQINSIFLISILVFFIFSRINFIAITKDLFFKLKKLIWKENFNYKYIFFPENSNNYLY